MVIIYNERLTFEAALSSQLTLIWGKTAILQILYTISRIDLNHVLNDYMPLEIWIVYVDHHFFPGEKLKNRVLVSL